MVEKLKEVVKKIIQDEKSAKEFGKLKTLKEVHEKCKEFGYEYDYEEFEKDYNQIVYGVNQEIPPEELCEISGGTMNKKFSKTLATMLSVLTLSTAAMPSSSAVNYPMPKRVTTFIKQNPGKILLMALGATATVAGGITLGIALNRIYDEKKNNNSNTDNSQNKNEENTPKSKDNYNSFSSNYFSNQHTNNNESYNHRDYSKNNNDTHSFSNGHINNNKPTNNYQNYSESMDDYSHYKFFSKLFISTNENGQKFISALNKIKKDVFKMNDNVEFVKENNINGTSSLRIKGMKPTSKLEVNLNIKTGDESDWREYRYDAKSGNDSFNYITFANFDNQIVITLKNKNDEGYKVESVASLQGFVRHILNRPIYEKKEIYINGTFMRDRSMYDEARSIFSSFIKKNIPINKYL